MDETLEKVKKIVAAKVKNQDVPLDADLSTLGLDSLDKAEIMINIEGEFGIEFTEDEMAKIKTVNDLLTIINGKLKK
jgi:acyl carrier protein